MRQGLPSYAKPDLWLDEDHALELTTREGESEPSGALFWHREGPNKTKPSATPGWCCGAFHWSGPGAWALVSREPLHVEPSIQCSCGVHGWIRGGKWVQA